jgi:hypothetical protein
MRDDNYRQVKVYALRSKKDRTTKTACHNIIGKCDDELKQFTTFVTSNNMHYLVAKRWDENFLAIPYRDNAEEVKLDIKEKEFTITNETLV